MIQYGRELVPARTTGTRCYLKKMLLCPMPGYRDQFIRPMQLNLSGQVLNNIGNYVNQPGVVTASGIANNVPNLFLPSLDPTVRAGISGGWGESRFIYLLEMVWDDGYSVSSNIISGYTDYLGGTTPGTYDPNMTFYINTVTPIRVQTIKTATNVYQRPVVEGSNYVVSNDRNSGNAGLFNMTPGVVANSLVNDTYDFGGQTIDSGAMVNSMLSLSTVNNTSPARYMTNMLNSFKNVIIDDNISPMGGRGQLGRFSEVRSNLNEASFVEDRFLHHLGNVTGEYTRSWFTLRELASMVPEQDIYYGNTIIEVKRKDIFPLEYHSYMNDSQMTTQQAVTIVNTLPSIMMDYAITELAFDATNELTGLNVRRDESEVVIKGIKSFSESLDMGPYLHQIENKIKAELVPIISNNHASRFVAKIDCRLMGDTTIWINLNGAGNTPYVIPTFASSTYMSTLTPNYQDIKNLSNGLNVIMGQMDYALQGYGINNMNTDTGIYMGNNAIY